MKKHNTYSLMPMVLIGIFALLTSCEGPEGPAGPAGPAGPQGLAGTTGAQGPAGQNGNANVIASSWITNVWTVASNGMRRHDNIPAPEITQNILDKAVILIYWRPSSTTETAKLIPCPIYNTGVNVFTIDGIFLIGFISVFTDFPRAPATTGIEVGFPNSQVRYVIIPPSTNGRTRLPENPEDYYATCAWLGIEP